MPELQNLEFTYDFFKEIAGAFIADDVTDFHIAAGTAPYIRKAKALVELRVPAQDDETGEVMYLPIKPMSPEDTRNFIEDLLHDAQKENPTLAENLIEEMNTREIDTTLSLPGVSRFRVHICKQRATFTCALRVVPSQIPKLSGFPKEIKNFINFKNGLIIVAGKAGSGKSTTLATLISEINQTQQKKIITLEDPIEYLHRHDHSMVIQREIGVDTKNYTTGLLSALREDPDVIVVGELRDVESFEIALNAAESGCLVMTTMHSSNAAEALERIVSMFSDDKQNQIRSQLATVLRGIICQQLIPCACPKDFGSPLVCAFEILSQSSGIANIIRKGDFKSIPTAMQSGSGHRLMKDSLQSLKNNGLISEQDWFNRFSLIDQAQRGN